MKHSNPFHFSFPSIPDIGSDFFKDAFRFGMLGADHPPRFLAYLWSLIRHHSETRGLCDSKDKRILKEKFSKLYPVVRDGLALILEVRKHIAAEPLRTLMINLRRPVADFRLELPETSGNVRLKNLRMGDTCFQNYLGARPNANLRQWLKQHHRTTLELSQKGPSRAAFEAALEPYKQRLRNHLHSRLRSKYAKAEELYQDTVWIAWLKYVTPVSLTLEVLLGIADRAIRRAYKEIKRTNRLVVSPSVVGADVEEELFDGGYADPAQSLPSDWVQRLDQELCRDVMMRVVQWPEKIIQAFCFLGVRMMDLTPLELAMAWSESHLGHILVEIQNFYDRHSNLSARIRAETMAPLYDVFLEAAPKIRSQLRRTHKLKPNTPLILTSFKAFVGNGSVQHRAARISHWINEFKIALQADFRRRPIPGVNEWLA